MAKIKIEGKPTVKLSMTTDEAIAVYRSIDQYNCHGKDRELAGVIERQFEAAFEAAGIDI